MASNENTKGPTTQKWKGYTVDELRFQKALTIVKIDMKKEAISNQFSNFPKVVKTSIIGKIKSTFVGKAFGFVTKFFKK